MDNRAIFEFLNSALLDGNPSVLVTVVSVVGSSMRDPGAHMAACSDGSFVGSLSGGCIERAVVSEALDVLKAGKPRIVRFGQGSPYLDIKLPCGGGLDVHFMPLLDNRISGDCLRAIEARKPFSIDLPTEIGEAKCTNHGTEPGISQHADRITVCHEPNPRLLIIGHGAAMVSLARLSREMRFDVRTLTSDLPLKQQLADDGFDVGFLKAPDQIDAIDSDPWTAIVFLFHDHDWEGHLMVYTLAQPHFYFGAMGGKTAHQGRKKMLKSLGVSRDKIESIRAPIGLFHSSRDPDTLALSVLAEITQSFHNRN